METENKENLQLPVVDKTIVDTLKDTVTSNARTPLLNVNNLAFNRSTKKAYYSQVTPTGKTPSRKYVTGKGRVRPSLLVYQDTSRSDTEDVLLNTLVCRKVEEVITRAKQQYENELAEKEKTISNLQEQIKTVGDTSCGVQADPVAIETDSCGIQTDGYEILADHLSVETDSCGTQADLISIETDSCRTQADLISQADSIPIETDTCGTQADSIPIETDSCGTQADSITIETDSCGTQADSIPIETDSCGTQADSITIETDSCGTQADSIPIETDSCGTQADSIPIETDSCGTQADSIHIETDSCGTQADSITVENDSCGTQVDCSSCARCEHVDDVALNEQVSAFVNRLINKCAADLKSEEIAELLHQTSGSDRDHQLQSANALIQELQTELFGYCQLTDSLVLAETLQARIQEGLMENYRKVKEAAERLARLQTQTETQTCEMQAKMDTNEVQMKRCRQEKAEVLQKYDCMETTLETSRDSLAQMEALYKTTSAELMITKSLIQINSSDIVTATKSYENSQSELMELQTRYTADTSSLAEEKEQLAHQLTDVEGTLRVLRSDMADTQTTLLAVQKEADDLRETVSSLDSQLHLAGETTAQQHEENQSLQNKTEALLSSIHEKDEEMRKLKKDLQDLETRLQSVEQQSEAELDLLKRRCDSLLIEQSLSQQAHINKVRDMEGEIERRDCSGQLRTAKGLIQDLQSELSEYTELADSLKLAEALQAKVQEVVTENYHKVKMAADKLLGLKRNISQEKSEVIAQKKQNEEEKVDYDGMKVALETSQSSMMQFQTLYSSTSADLLSASNQVQILSAELVTTKQAYEECQQAKATLVTQMEDKDENEKAGFMEIQGLEVSLRMQTDELEKTSKQSSDAEIRHREKVELMQREKNQLNLVVDNLQRTLDSREEDVDQLEKELYEIREYMADKLEALDKYKAVSDANNIQLLKCRTENLELRDNCAVMQCTIQELKETIQSNAYELSETKSHASRMLHEQGEEITECSQSTSVLAQKMDNVLQELRRKVGISTQQEDQPKDDGHRDQTTSKEEVVKSVKKQKPRNTRKSFLSEIFLAASQQDSEHSPPLKLEEEMSDISEETGVDTSQSDGNISGISPLQNSSEDSPATVSRSKLGFSASSAFAPVRTTRSLIVPQKGPLELANVNSSVSQSNDVSAPQQEVDSSGGEGPHTGSEGPHTGSERPHTGSEGTTDVTLVNQVSTIDEYFMEIIRLANIIEKASRLSIEEVNADNEELRINIERLQIVEEEVIRKEHKVVEQRDTITSLEERLYNMADNLERFSDQESLIMSQQSEVQKLQSEVRSVKGEKRVIRDQLTEAMGKSEVTAGGASGTQVLNLKMKIQKLRDKLLKKDEYYEELGNKASRRLQVFEENWRRAEDEVYRFDELMEIVRETLTKREDLTSEHADLNRLLKLIQGQKTLPSDKDPASVPLKSIKTVKW